MNNFNDVYVAFYRKSYLFVKSYVHDSLVAEDIASESLIILWEKMKNQNIDPVQPFLLTILKNKSLDYLKHEAIGKKVYKSLYENLNRELEIRISVLQSCDPNEIFSAEIQQIIQDTLATLPLRTREIFVMSRFENKSHKEIAKMYEISVKGIDYHIALSLKALKLSLKDYLPFLLFFLLKS